MKRFFLLILLSVLLLSAEAQSSCAFRHIEGTGSEYVTAIAGDSRNRIWIGTLSGIIRIGKDGSKHYRLPAPDGRSSVDKIIAPQNGIIRVNNSKASYIYNEESDSFIIAEEQKQDSVLTSSDGFVWSESGIVTGFGKHIFHTGLRPKHTGAGLYSDGTRLWIFDRFSPDFEIYSLSDGSKIPSMLPPGTIVKDMARFTDGSTAVSTNNTGLFIVSKDGSVLRHYTHQTDDSLSLSSNHLTALFTDFSSGRLLIGTARHGVVEMPLYNYSSEIVNLPVVEDVSCFVEDGKGKLLIGLDGGGIAVTDRGTGILNTAGSNLPSDIITSLYRLPDGNITGATYGAGLFRIRNGKAEKYSPQNSHGRLSHSRSIATDRYGNMWIATFFNGVARIENDSVSFFNTKNSALLTDYITDIAASKSGDSIFVATGYGLYSFDAATLDSHEIAVESPTGKIAANCLTVDSAGRIWIGTDNGVIIPGKQLAGLPPGKIISITPGTNCVFAATADTLCRISDDGEKAYSYILSIPGTEFHFNKYALKIINGILYAGGTGKYLKIVFSGAAAPSESDGFPSTGVVIAAFLVILLISASVVVVKRKSRLKKEVPVPSDTKSKTMEANSPLQADVDAEFMKRVDTVVASQLGNEDFSVEDFGSALGMSRSNLYKKIMALTGQSPLEYLRNRRLEEGKAMLDNASGSHIGLRVSEVAAKVGMSPRQFSKFFKLKYGHLPSE